MPLVLRFLSRMSPAERRTLKWQLVAMFIIVTALNLGFYWERAFREQAIRRNLPNVMHGWDGLAWYVWMPAAPATLFLIRRYSFKAEAVGRSVLRLMVGSAVIYFVVTNTRYLFRILPNLWHPPALALPVSWASYLRTQLERTPLDFLTYTGLFAASFAIDYYTKYRQRAEEVIELQLRTAKIQSELSQLQLTALQRQLHPHFLFNAFNAISTLVRQQRNELAIAMLAQVAALLRSILDNVELRERSFAEELEFVRSYLAVEQLRFGEKLRAEFEIAPEVRTACVPNLLLQPLVENAIKHAIGRRTDAGTIKVTAVRRGARLQVAVIDDGPGDAAEPALSMGVGLRNTRSRLTHAYGTDFGFSLLPRAEGGMIATLDLPWRDEGKNVSAEAAA